MSQNKVVVSSGIRHFPVITDTGVDTGRSVDFNPGDQGFAEELYGLVSKLAQIHEKKVEATKDVADPAERFDLSRAEDADMRKAVDALFGEGFCGDVFKTRLFAVVDGMTVIEAFLYSLLDEIKVTYPDKNVLLVCHGGVFRVIHTYFHDMTNNAYFHHSAPNAELVEYQYE